MNNPEPINYYSHGDCLFFLDANGQLAYVNNDFCVDLGYTRDELIAQHLDELGVLLNIQKFKTILMSTKNDKTSHCETFVRCKNGKTFPAELNVTHTPHGCRMLLRCDLHLYK